MVLAQLPFFKFVKVENYSGKPSFRTGTVLNKFDWFSNELDVDVKEKFKENERVRSVLLISQKYFP